MLGHEGPVDDTPDRRIVLAVREASLMEVRPYLGDKAEAVASDPGS